VNNVLKEAWKEAVKAYLELLSRHFHGGADEITKGLRTVGAVAENRTGHFLDESQNCCRLIQLARRSTSVSIYSWYW
jgi:hypothetical protein